MADDILVGVALQQKYSAAAKLAEKNELHNAIPLFEECVANAPEWTQARVALCSSLLEVGRRDAARSAAQAFEQLVPTQEYEWKVVHDILIRLSDLTRAEIVTDKFHVATGGTPELRLSLIEIRLRELHGTMHNRIRQDLSSLLRRPSPTASFWTRVADVQKRLGDLQDSLTSVETALQLARKDFNLTYQRILLLSSLRRHREARRALPELISLIPDIPLFWTRTSQLARELRESRVAELCIDKALASIKPWQSDEMCELARVMLEQGRTEGVDCMLRTAIGSTTDVGTLKRIFDLSHGKLRDEVALLAGSKLLELRPMIDVLEKMRAIRFTITHRPANRSH